MRIPQIRPCVQPVADVLPWGVGVRRSTGRCVVVLVVVRMAVVLVRVLVHVIMDMHMAVTMIMIMIVGMKIRMRMQVVVSHVLVMQVVDVVHCIADCGIRYGHLVW